MFRYLCVLFFIFCFSKAQSELLLEKPYPFFSPFKLDFPTIDSISFNLSTQEKQLGIDLNKCIKLAMGEKTKTIAFTAADSIPFGFLSAKMQFLFTLFKLKDNLFLLTSYVIVPGNSFNDIEATIPIYGNDYVIQIEKNAKEELEKQIQEDVRHFFSLYKKNNAQNTDKLALYIANF